MKFADQEFIKHVKLNKQQVDQLLSNRNQAPIQLPRYKTIRIKLKSYLPDVFLSKSSHIRLVFYLNQLDKPVYFQHEIE